MTRPTTFEEEIFLSARRRAALAWVFAGICLLIALASVFAVAALVPLKESRPYLFMVNETNATTERVVEVQPMDIAEDEAVIQANVVRYVIDRETYDKHDNRTRIERVVRLSGDTALNDLQDTWADPSTNDAHPDKLYGDTVRILTRVRSVSLDTRNDTALVFLTLERRQSGTRPVTANGVASLSYAFDPASVRTIEELWDNPLGFKVLTYRLDRQTGGG